MYMSQNAMRGREESLPTVLLNKHLICYTNQNIQMLELSTFCIFFDLDAFVFVIPASIHLQNERWSTNMTPAHFPSRLKVRHLQSLLIGIR